MLIVPTGATSMTVSNGRLMPAGKKRQAELGPPPHPPHVINVDAVYSLKQAAYYLGFRESTFKRAIRLGQLRVTRRGGGYRLLGTWLLAWLESGEVGPHGPASAAAAGIDG
jgi:excisionase family DNA binding protein